eukprot:m.3417 g.3417  ORF g.3417 m.3417 type:complete len:79 (-) comp5279_c0_seq1:95-331(-)
MAEAGGILSEDQQAKLHTHKRKLRFENEQYLRKHPELKQMIGMFTKEVLSERPANIPDFASRFFTSEALKPRLDAESA